MTPASSAAAAWWRPDASPAVPTRRARGRAAFGALALYTVILVAAPQEFVPALAPLRLAFTAAAVAIVAALADRWAGRARTRPWPRELTLVAALLAWAVLTVPLSYWPGGSVGVLLGLYLKSVAVFALLATVVDSEARLRQLVGVLVACAAIIAVTALNHYREGVLMAGARDRIAGYGTSGMAGNPNDLALLLNIVIPFEAALMLTTRRYVVKAAAVAVLLASVGGVVVTFSRGGFIALAMTGALCLWQLARRGAVLAVVGVLTASCLAVAFVPDRYAARLETVTNLDADATGSAQDRWRDTVVATTFALHHPLVGAGLGMDYLALNDVRGREWLSVHNTYLNYAVDLGAVGLALFLAIFASAWLGAARVERRRRASDGPRRRDALRTYATAARIALTTFAVAACFHPIAYHAFFYYLAGLAVAIRQIDDVPGAAS
jgi:probable O-glycosylation ligase (exosortase A-associated)